MPGPSFKGEIVEIVRLCSRARGVRVKARSKPRGSTELVLDGLAVCESDKVEHSIKSPEWQDENPMNSPIASEAVSVSWTHETEVPDGTFTDSRFASKHQMALFTNSHFATKVPDGALTNSHFASVRRGTGRDRDTAGSASKSRNQCFWKECRANESSILRIRLSSSSRTSSHVILVFLRLISRAVLHLSTACRFLRSATSLR